MTKRTTPPPPSSADTTPGEHHCHRCNKRTRWEWNRTKRVQHCVECRDRFPCVRDCGHTDCIAFRNRQNRKEHAA